MNSLAAAATPATRRALLDLDEALRTLPQVRMETRHEFHAGMYARTIRVPAQTAMTNVRIVIPTLLVLSGHMLVFGEDGTHEYSGYNVLPCAAGRQNAFYALEDTDMTMLFATDAETVEDAENEFTDEPERLGSRKEG